MLRSTQLLRVGHQYGQAIITTTLVSQNTFTASSEIPSFVIDTSISLMGQQTAGLVIPTLLAMMPF